MAKLHYQAVIRQIDLQIKKIEPVVFKFVVGFRAEYAIYVHEDLNTPRKTGRSKFLTDPFTENQRRYELLVSQLLRGGYRFKECIKFVAEDLKLLAQYNCPVDTGRLRNSAYVKEG